MTGAFEDLEDCPGPFHAPLYRLVRMGVGTERDGLAEVAWTRELGLQHFRGVGLVEETRLEVEAGGKAHVGMAWTRVAVDTTVCASAIGIDGLLEWDIRRVVGADDRPRPIGLERRRNALGHLVLVPTVVDLRQLLPVESAGWVREGSPADKGLSANDA